MARNDQAELGWLHHLPEAGSIVTMADEEAALLKTREELVARLNALDVRLAALRSDARRKALAGWTAKEIHPRPPPLTGAGAWGRDGLKG